MTLLDRHLAFVNALRDAGLPVSLAEGLDAVSEKRDPVFRPDFPE